MARLWTDWKLPGAGFSETSSFNSSPENTWSTPGNITAIDGSNATTSSNKDASNALVGGTWNWGLPTKGTVTPRTIEQRLTGSGGSGTVSEQIKWGGGSMTEHTGGTFLLDNNITAANLNNANFRFGVRHGSVSQGNRSLSYDAIEARVEYDWTYVPSAPSGFSVGKTPEAQANLTWTPDATETVVIQASYSADGGSASGPWMNLATVPGSPGSYDDIGPAGENFYRIAFVGSEGTGAFTAVQSITVAGAGGDSQIYLGSTQIGPDQLYLGGSKIEEVYLGSTKMWPPEGALVPPDAPLLTLIGFDFGLGTVDLSWTAITDAVEYEIWRDHGNGFIFHDQVTGTTYQDDTIVDGQNYSYKVRAGTVAGGLSDFSNAVNVSASVYRFELVDQAQDTSGGPTITYPNMALGAPSDYRKIVICIPGFGTETANQNPISSVTVAGISATKRAQASETGPNYTAITADIWEADVPNGTSGDIVVTYLTSQTRNAIFVYRVENYDWNESQTFYSDALSNSYNFNVVDTDMLLATLYTAGDNIASSDIDFEASENPSGRNLDVWRREMSADNAAYNVAWTWGTGANPWMANAAVKYRRAVIPPPQIYAGATANPNQPAGTTLTISNASYGGAPPASDRMIAVVFGSGFSGEPTSDDFTVTIGGVPAVTTYLKPNSAGGIGLGVCFATAMVPTGTSGDIVITTDHFTNGYQLPYHVFGLSNMRAENTVPVFTADEVAYANPVTRNYEVKENDIILCGVRAYQSPNQSLTWSWTGATDRGDLSYRDNKDGAVGFASHLVTVDNAAYGITSDETSIGDTHSQHGIVLRPLNIIPIVPSIVLEHQAAEAQNKPLVDTLEWTNVPISAEEKADRLIVACVGFGSNGSGAISDYINLEIGGVAATKYGYFTSGSSVDTGFVMFGALVPTGSAVTIRAGTQGGMGTGTSRSTLSVFSVNDTGATDATPQQSSGQTTSAGASSTSVDVPNLQSGDMVIANGIMKHLSATGSFDLTSNNFANSHPSVIANNANQKTWGRPVSEVVAGTANKTCTWSSPETSEDFISGYVVFRP